MCPGRERSCAREEAELEGERLEMDKGGQRSEVSTGQIRKERDKVRETGSEETMRVKERGSEKKRNERE